MSVVKTPWKWGKKTYELLHHYGIKWWVTPALTLEQLGSSPGDCLWDGKMLWVESDCPRMWVVHEVAHYIITKRDLPEFLSLRNWGTEQGGQQGFIADGKEVTAAHVNVALLIRMNLSWRYCADQLNLVGDYWEGKSLWGTTYDYRVKYEGQKHWNTVREKILAIAEPYLEGGPYGKPQSDS